MPMEPVCESADDRGEAGRGYGGSGTRGTVEAGWGH